MKKAFKLLKEISEISGDWHVIILYDDRTGRICKSSVCTETVDSLVDFEYSFEDKHSMIHQLKKIKKNFLKKTK